MKRRFHRSSFKISEGTAAPPEQQAAANEVAGWIKTASEKMKTKLKVLKPN